MAPHCGRYGAWLYQRSNVKPLRSMNSNSCGTEYDRSRGFSSASASASAFAASRDPRSSVASG